MCFYCDNPAGDYMAEVITPIIARNGWAVQAVSGSQGRAPFAYTVGLVAMGLPELLVTGLKPAAAGALLNAVGAAPGLRPGELLEVDGRQLEVVHLPHPEAHLYVAHNLYGENLRAMQLVWQDDRGHFPWCKSHRAGRGGQPVLGPRFVQEVA